MKIAIPMNHLSLDKEVASSFGRALHMLIYVVETKHSSFVPNTACVHQGGAGIKTSQLIIDEKVDVLICPRCGENAYEALSKTNIRIYQSIAGTAQANIDAFKEGRLSLLIPHSSGINKG